MPGTVTTPQREGFWEQIAVLRPQLRRDVDILVQDYRGERWYLLHDQALGRFLRFNGTAYEFLGRLDGDLSVEEIIEIANTGQVEPVLTEETVMHTLAQLHAAEVLRGGLPLGVQDLLERHQQDVRLRRRRALTNPLALRIKLFDPDRLLSVLIDPLRWVFSWVGLLIWMAVVGVAVVLAIAYIDPLIGALDSKTLNAGEVLMFWLLYPLIKALHELAHGLAVKTWGGEVHETGISLLVFMPVPYVDASASWAFRDKRRRAIIGAAGILVELFLAAIGFLVWLAVEPGLVKEAALNVALIGTVSTLLFNGNPLLRFDGYYVLEDVVEIPNLAARSGRYYLYLIQRYLLGVGDAQSPVTAHGERAWFACYGLLSPLYRIFVLIGIAWYLASEFLFVGIALAIWAIAMQLIKPLLLSLKFIATSPRLQARRLRGFAIAVAALTVVIGLLHLPAPSVTLAQGVVWYEPQARVVSGVDGFVRDYPVTSGQWVSEGEVIVQLHDADLLSQREVLGGRLRELSNEQIALRQSHRVEAAMVEADIVAVRKQLDDVQRQIRELTIRASRTGRFYPVDPHAWDDKLVRQGDAIGYIVDQAPSSIRAVVEQADIGLLRTQKTTAEVMPAHRFGEPLSAEIVREVPAGSRELPSPVLGAAGGGLIAVETADPGGTTAVTDVFQVELALPADAEVAGIGERVYVRFLHGNESLWRQWSRQFRQLLLSRLRA